MGNLNFREFLEGYGVFKEFVRNADRAGRIRSLEPVILYDDPADDWVNDAFEWSETPEGHGFWRDIHEEWIWANNIAQVEGDSVEPGFPLFDPLGLLLLASELEVDDDHI